jgi:CysZ protein
LRLIGRNPRLWPHCLAPLGINLGLFALFFWFGYDRFVQWVKPLLPSGEGWWWALAFYALAALAVVVLSLMVVLLFTVVGSLIAAPFLELLSRRVEALEAYAGVATWAETSLWQDARRVAGQMVKLLALYLAVMIPLWLLNLLPVVGNLLYAGLAFLVTCFFLALNFLDLPLDRRGLSLRAKLAYLRGLGLTGLAFGAAVFALGVIPVLNLAMLPLAAAGATLLYLERPPAGDDGPKA